LRGRIQGPEGPCSLRRDLADEGSALLEIDVVGVFEVEAGVVDAAFVAGAIALAAPEAVGEPVPLPLFPGEALPGRLHGKAHRFGGAAALFNFGSGRFFGVGEGGDEARSGHVAGDGLIDEGLRDFFAVAAHGLIDGPAQRGPGLAGARRAFGRRAFAAGAFRAGPLVWLGHGVCFQGNGEWGNYLQNRGQGTEIRDQGSGVRDQGSGDRGQRTEIRDQGSGVGFRRG
jgi:hypothetical protein